MPLAVNIQRGGFSAGQAKAMCGFMKTGLSAAGSLITTATDLTADVNVVDTVTGTDGVQLYNGEVGDSQIIFNNQSTYHLLVYPPTTSHKINQIPAGTAHRLPPYTVCTYWKTSATQIVAVMSR